MGLKGVFSQKPFLQKFLVFAFITFVSTLTFLVISYAFVAEYFDIPIENLPSFLTDYNNQSSIKALKLLHLFTSIGIFVFPTILFAYLTGFDLQLRRKINRQNILLVTAIILIVTPFIAYLTEWNQGLMLPESLESVQRWMEASEESALQLTKAFLHMEAFSELLINLALLALLPAIGEELFFRGVLQRLLAKWTGKIHFAIFISAFLFSAIHLQFFGFFPRLILGIFLGYMFYWSKNLWLPIFAHFLWNGLFISFSYHFISEKIQIDFLNNESTVNMNGAVISFLAVILLMYLLYKKSDVKKDY